MRGSCQLSCRWIGRHSTKHSLTSMVFLLAVWSTVDRYCNSVRDQRWGRDEVSRIEEVYCSDSRSPNTQPHQWMRWLIAEVVVLARSHRTGAKSIFTVKASMYHDWDFLFSSGRPITDAIHWQCLHVRMTSIRQLKMTDFAAELVTVKTLIDILRSSTPSARFWATRRSPAYGYSVDCDEVYPGIFIGDM